MFKGFAIKSREFVLVILIYIVLLPEDGLAAIRCLSQCVQYICQRSSIAIKRLYRCQQKRLVEGFDFEYFLHEQKKVTELETRSLVVVKLSAGLFT